jgi:hypothetical protein
MFSLPDDPLRKLFLPRQAFKDRLQQGYALFQVLKIGD